MHRSIFVVHGAAREHARGGSIHSHDRILPEVLRCQHPGKVGVEQTVGVLIGENPCGLAQLAEGQTQGGSAADGVTIGAA